MSTLDYLDDERKKLWAEILKIQEQINNKIRVEIDDLRNYIDKSPPEAEHDARQASRKASEYRNKAERSKELAEQFAETAKKASEEAQHTTEKYKQQLDELSKETARAQQLRAEIQKLEEKTQTINNLFEQQEYLAEKISTLASLAETSEDSENRINAIVSNVTKRKNEIDTLYYEIFGSEEINESTGQKVRKNDGLKTQLESAFKQAKSEIEKTKEKVNSFQNKVRNQLDQQIQKTEETFTQNLASWQSNYENALNQINSLLPAAMTAGLSSAYSEKRTAELEESRTLNTEFKNAIRALVACSLIPFLVGIILLFQGKTLQETILELPRLTLSIFPLYIPLLWLAYSTSKKIKLSKRLVEEYTHKEVLSKTFEGLSRQIESTDSELASHLRTKLLHNLLDTSYENPGKLISDYNNADHPILDAIERGAKLGQALDKLAAIPGIEGLSKALEKRRNAQRASQAKDVEKGLASISKSDAGEV